MRYSKICLGLSPHFSTLIGQLRRVPLFGARPWRSSCPGPRARTRHAHTTRDKGRDECHTPHTLQTDPTITNKPLPPQPWHLERISASYHRAGTLPTRTHAPRAYNAGQRAGRKPRRQSRDACTARTSTHSPTRACSWMVTSQLRFGIPEKYVYASSTEIYFRAQGMGLVDAKGSRAA